MALAWRLHRGSLYAWAAAYLAFGLLDGGAAQAAADLVNGNQQLADMVARLRGQSGPADAWLASVLSLGHLVAAGYAISAALRMRAEETSLRLEQVLAAPWPGSGGWWPAI